MEILSELVVSTRLQKRFRFAFGYAVQFVCYRLRYSCSVKKLAAASLLQSYLALFPCYLTEVQLSKDCRPS